MKITFKQFKKVMKDLGFRMRNNPEMPGLVFEHHKAPAMYLTKYTQHERVRQQHIVATETLVKDFELCRHLESFTFVEYILRTQIKDLRKQLADCRRRYD